MAAAMTRQPDMNIASLLSEKPSVLDTRRTWAHYSMEPMVRQAPYLWGLDKYCTWE
jgi:hypothetical protein